MALPTSPAWWEVLDAKLEDIENIAGHITSLYHRPLPISTLPLTIEQVEPYLRGELNKSVSNGTPAAAAAAATTASPSTSGKGTRVSRFS